MSKSFVPLPFDVKKPVLRSAMEEWKPHAKMSEKTFEWWYVTTHAYDASGNHYFIFLCLPSFTGDGYQRMMGQTLPAGQRVLAVEGQVSDYSNNKFYTILDSGVLKESEMWDDEKNAVLCNVGSYNISWSYENDKMKLKMVSPKVSFDFNLSNADEIVLHRDKHGVDGFIQEGAEDDFSFYYSIPRAPINGTLSTTDESGKTRNIFVTGVAWIDRQWGDFFTLSWEWSSFRFNNGARLHLYNFFNGYQEALYMSADGKIQRFDNFVVKQNGYARSPLIGTWVSCGWTYEFPIEIEGSKHYTAIPYSSRNREFIEIPAFKSVTYEGGSRLFNDETGEQVGVSVNESGDSRIMDNLPYGKNQR